jgi:hypothetical protein
MTERVELYGIQRLNRHLDPVQVLTHGQAFAVKFKGHSTAFTFHWLDARKALVPQVKQQFKFLFDFYFTLDFVNLGKELSTFGFNKVMGIYRAVAYASEGGNLAQTEFIGDLVRILFR